MDTSIINYIFELLKYAIPAIVCIVTMYLLLQNQIKLNENKIKEELKLKAFSHYMPLKLSAYERTILYLERIHPDSLISRSEPQNKSAQFLNQQFLMEINSEYEHNIVQQIYISEANWKLVKESKIEIINILSIVSKKLKPTSTSAEFISSISNYLKEREHPLKSQITINKLREEVIDHFS